MKEKRNIKNLLTKINIINMTKVSVFGQQPTETKELKKIEFVHFFNGAELVSPVFEPDLFENIVLLRKSYKSSNLDLIYAYNENESGGNIYLGHWNDGVV